LTAVADDEVLLEGDDSGIRLPRLDFVSARDIPATDLMSPPASIGSKKPRGVQRPFVNPIRRNAENSALHDVHGLRQTKLSADYGTRGHNSIQQDAQEPLLNEDLEWSMDFEHRKEVATRRRRDDLRAAALEVENSGTRGALRTSPHKNRYNAAITTLEAGYPSPSSIETLKEPFKTSLPDGDPRAYLMRRQKSIMSQTAKSGEIPKLTRAKSSRLPLENVSENGRTHNLVLRLSTNMDKFQMISNELMKSDFYVKKGNVARGLGIGGLETTEVASRIQAAVVKWMSKEGVEKCEVEYMFENLIASN